MRKMVRSIMLGVCSIAVLSTLPVSAATIYSGYFDPISNNSGSAYAVSDQFRVDVGIATDGRAQFTFFNLGPIESEIAEIYWEWTTTPALLNPVGAGNFSYIDTISPWTLDPDLSGNGQQAVSPGNLSGGETVGFSALAGADGDSGGGGGRNAPQQETVGITTGNSATFFIQFTNTELTTAEKETALLSQLLSPPSGNRTMRFGLHVRRIDGALANTSDTFYSPTDYTIDDPNYNPPLADVVVPVPAAAGLGFLGMALVGVVRRKKS